MTDSVEADEIRDAPAAASDNGVDGQPGTGPGEGADQPASPAVADGDQDAIREQILDALRHVHDPELGINVVDLGLVYGVTIDQNNTAIAYIPREFQRSTLQPIRSEPSAKAIPATAFLKRWRVPK